MQEYAIEIQDLTRTFRVPEKGGIFRAKTITALDHVNLKIKEKEIFGLLGPNGAGKTTLVKILATLLTPSSGRATVGGYDIVEDGQKVRGIISYVYMAQRSFFWRLTGRQSLEYFGTLYNIPMRKLKGRIENALEVVELADRADERVTRYSTGMRFRLAIARGLLPDTPVLLMDEPTLGLDPHSARKIRDYVKEKLVGEEGKTVFLATNNLSEAEYLCDRVAVIHEGSVKVVDSPARIRGNRALEEVFLELTGEKPT